MRRAWKHNWAHWAYFQPERLSGEKKIARWILKPFEHNLLWIFLGDLPKPWRMRVLQPRNGCKLFHIVQLSIWSARSSCPDTSHVYRCCSAFILFSSTRVTMANAGSITTATTGLTTSEKQKSLLWSSVRRNFKADHLFIPMIWTWVRQNYQINPLSSFLKFHMTFV